MSKLTLVLLIVAFSCFLPAANAARRINNKREYQELLCQVDSRYCEGLVARDEIEKSVEKSESAEKLSKPENALEKEHKDIDDDKDNDDDVDDADDDDEEEQNRREMEEAQRIEEARARRRRTRNHRRNPFIGKRKRVSRFGKRVPNTHKFNRKMNHRIRRIAV